MKTLFYKVVDSEQIILSNKYDTIESARTHARQLARVNDRHFKIHDWKGSVIDAAYPTTEKGMF